MPERKIRLTTKDFATLLQMEKSGELKLKPEFQREAVRPKATKANFVESILNGRPIRPIYLLRRARTKAGRTQLYVIDGQQRIRALSEFWHDGFGLMEPGGSSVTKGYKGKRYSHLPAQMQRKFWSFKFIVLELSGYSESDLRDVFALMHKHIVLLSKQGLRHVQMLSSKILLSASQSAHRRL